MKLFKIAMLVCALGFTFASCGDDDNTAPVVTITSPTNGTSFSPGDTITFMGTTTEDSKLSNITLSSDIGLNESVTTFDSDTEHASNYNITLDPATAAGTFSLVLTATDEAGNVGSDSVDITIL